MKKELQGKIVLSMAVSFFALTLSAQEGDKNVKQKLTDQNGKPTLITFNEKSSYKAGDSQQVFKDQLGIKENSAFSKIKSESDKLGFVHEKFQQYYKGIKVEFATYMLHSKSGRLESMNGEFYDMEDVNTNPKLSPQQALEYAVKKIGAIQYLWDVPSDAAAMNYQKPTGELVLVPIMDNGASKHKENNVRLAYKFDIYAANPVSRGDIYIDAVSGESLFYNATIKHLGEYSHGGHTKVTTPEAKTSVVVAANAATRYSGTQSIQTTLSGSSYILSDTSRGLGVQTYNSARTATYPTTNFTDADNNWTAAEFNNTNKDNGALDAHWGAEMTYDYWSAVHGRNSYDNAGAKIKSYVHYNLIAAGYPDNNNAFWNGSVMTYGDGSGTVFDVLTAMDVAGHEIGHAVCTFTANLAYQKESGAMNEAFSDIWGACIEYRAAPTKSTWLIGEDIERRAGHTALRSMSNPNVEGQPDTYGGTYWVNINCTPSNANDQCGVHTNSGVLNHWFYILSVGKSGTNDIGSAFNVTGITIDKAARIAYRLESVYLSANSTYANARAYGIQAATDLYGAGSAEVIATTNAFYAVGVGAAYVGATDVTAPTAPTNLAAAGTTSTTTNLSWTAATDNVAVTGYNVYNGATLVTTVTGLTYTVTGLTASTAYTFTVKAKDAAGNISAVSNAVNVTTSAATGDTTVPSTPTSLTASGTTTTTTNLSWGASTDNVGVTGYNVYKGAVLLTTVTGTTYTATGLTAATAYTFSVKAKDAAGNVSASSNVVNVTTQASTVTYCVSKGNSVADEYIDYVNIGGIANTTGGNAGYGNFTNLVGNVPYGSNTILFSAGFSGAAYTEYWKIWIDYNKNGVFDTTELVVSGTSAVSTNLTSTFTVPTTALAGTTRMRVSMKYSVAQTACETFSYGEVEDYTVNIGGGAIAATNTTIAGELGYENNIFDYTMYPNPTSEFINVRMADNREVSFRVINYLGQQVDSGKLSGNAIDVSKLGTGIYLFEVNDGQKSMTKKFIRK
ncbi:M4 family metallopeptidase [Flavobacterium sp. GT3R68]|uniref:M4 family metallopeptidase n=1 Tax=Flavobacterium sp. GT3R68 TaxID=2594437 RepID=UPI000F860432|nr:M4 family metallopeptidase [Flavobacterium sp. GT3R68]RTY95986.1 T9SS type A sorting domain-containing protein [Flavobacterium sp. GSN2]TRW93759.1 T9SS type A sorting domain-containing protein [Flavobacterium sp. GT3R68]